MTKEQIDREVKERTGEALSYYEFWSLYIGRTPKDNYIEWNSSEWYLEAGLGELPDITYFFLEDNIQTGGDYVIEQIFRKNKEEFFYMIPEKELAEIEETIEMYRGV